MVAVSLPRAIGLGVCKMSGVGAFLVDCRVDLSITDTVLLDKVGIIFALQSTKQFKADDKADDTDT